MVSGSNGIPLNNKEEVWERSQGRVYRRRRLLVIGRHLEYHQEIALQSLAARDCLPGIRPLSSSRCALNDINNNTNSNSNYVHDVDIIRINIDDANCINTIMLCVVCLYECGA